MLDANQIKRLLKQNLDVKRSDIRCRVDSSYRITLMSYSVSKEAVERVLEPLKSVSRCESSGEILSGGNTFVFVDYDYDCEIPSEAMHHLLKILDKSDLREQPRHIAEYHLIKDMQKLDFRRDITTRLIRQIGGVGQ